MGQYDGILLMTDFDGTLAIKGKVSPENSVAIKHFQDNGGVFVLASGRIPKFLNENQHPFTITKYAVMLNGTIICEDNGKTIVERFPLAFETFDFIDRVIIPNFPKLNFIRYYTYDRFFDVKLDGIRGEEILNSPIYKIILNTPTELSDEYLENITKVCYGKYAISRSWPNGIEFQAWGSTKGDAVARLKKLYGSRAETVIAAGDYENDVTMIQAADIGYAVGNAKDALKKVADRITVPCEEHAIARIIEEI